MMTARWWLGRSGRISSLDHRLDHLMAYVVLTVCELLSEDWAQRGPQGQAINQLCDFQSAL